MPDDNQGTLHSASEGGLIGLYPPAEPTQLLAGPSTSSELNTAHLRLIPIACFCLADMRFMFDSSFVLPQVKAEMQAYSDLRKVDPRIKGAPLTIFGHADPSYLGNYDPGNSDTAGPGDDYNKNLSGRRAIAIYAALVRDPAYWEFLYNTHLGADVWGAPAIQTMLDALGQQSSSAFSSSSQGSSSSAQSARAQDIANDSGQRQQLFVQYMNLLCGDVKLDKSADFLARGAGADLKGDVQGCSRFNPVMLFSSEDEAGFQQAWDDQDQPTLRGERDPRNSVNRRVMILVFRKGSQVLPTKWPCPSYKGGVADCTKRFWSNGQDRRSTHDSGAERKFALTHDTFACRFYQRLTNNAPCVPLDPILDRIRLHDAFGQIMPGVAYELSFAGQTLRNHTDNEAFILERLGQSADRCVIKWDPQSSDAGGAQTFTYQADLFLNLLDFTSDDAVKRALHNVGFPIDQDYQENLRHFQSIYSLDVTSQNDEPTRSKLFEIFLVNVARDFDFELQPPGPLDVGADDCRT
jgi:hypothetical protein